MGPDSRQVSNFALWLSNLIRDLAVEEVDVFRNVQFVLATVAHQVCVENIVALDQQLSHVTETERSQVELETWTILSSFTQLYK